MLTKKTITILIYLIERILTIAISGKEQWRIPIKSQLCGWNQYLTKDAKSCKECQTPCLQCRESPKNCTACHKNSKLVPITITPLNLTCNCRLGFFQDPRNNTNCLPCAHPPHQETLPKLCLNTTALRCIGHWVLIRSLYSCLYFKPSLWTITIMLMLLLLCDFFTGTKKTRNIAGFF